MNARLQTTLIALLLTGTALAEGFRDPMRPAGAAPAVPKVLAVQTLKLEGVIAGSQRVAIVNGRLARAGDVIAGARILEVLANGVRYERAGKIHSLTLPVSHADYSVRVARSPEPNQAEAKKP